ncbi:unnamed protein product [Lampetra planeri]
MALSDQSQVWFPTHVQVTVIQSRGLRIKGKQGLNDAYTLIQLGKEKYSTSVAEKTLCPRWQEDCTFEVPADASSAKKSTLVLTVMHRALVGGDKFLGQVTLPLRDIYQDSTRKKTQWYKLESKPGKKEKERGELEVNIQYMRNNLTASMFDLSLKDKKRTPFGKLRDKVSGKKKEGSKAGESSSAVVSSSAAMDSDEEGHAPDVEQKKKKTKTLSLFSKWVFMPPPSMLFRRHLPCASKSDAEPHPGLSTSPLASAEVQSTHRRHVSLTGIEEEEGNREGLPGKSKKSTSSGGSNPFGSDDLGDANPFANKKGADDPAHKNPFQEKSPPSGSASSAPDDPSGFVDKENDYVKTSPVELFSKKSPPSSNTSPTPAKTEEPFSFESISASVKSTGHIFVADDDDDNDVKTIPDEGPYAHLTRAELVQLLTRQQAELVDREQRIHAMEDYIDNLLVRVIEETPAILRQPERGAGRKAGRVW